MSIPDAKARFLTIMLLVVACILIVSVAVSFGLHVISYAVSWKTLVGILAVVAAALLAVEAFRVRLVMIKLPEPKNHTYITQMHAQTLSEKNEPEGEKLPITVLSPDEARVWLDDFLVEQQGKTDDKS